MCELCHIYKLKWCHHPSSTMRHWVLWLCLCLFYAYFNVLLIACKIYEYIYMNIYRNNKFTLNRTFRLFCVSSRCGVTLDLLVNELKKRRAAHGDFYQKFEVFLRSADMSSTEIVDCAKRLIESYPEIDILLFLFLFLFLFYHAPSLAGHDFW